MEIVNGQKSLMPLPSGHITPSAQAVKADAFGDGALVNL